MRRSISNRAAMRVTASSAIGEITAVFLPRRGFCGILQADAYSGYNRLYDAGRPQGAITPALCWAHARRQFFELADIATNPRRGKNAVVISPIALEAVRRIDALFEIERVINGRSTAERLRGAQRAEHPLSGRP